MKNSNAHQSRNSGSTPVSIRADYLARMSGAVFDIPPRIRSILIIVALIGVALIFMESLVGRQEQTIQLDKIIHFTGYSILAAVFVLILPPRLYIIGLLALVGMGVVIEILQGTTTRSTDLSDAYANTLGIIFGAIVGVAIRQGYAYLRKDIAIQEARKNLRRFGPGEIVMQEGSRTKDLFVIKTGKVKIEKNIDGKSTLLTVLSVGDVIGYSGAILGEPQLTSVTTLQRTTLYRLSLSELQNSADGQEAPVAMVLVALTNKLKEAGNKLAAANISLN